MRYAVIAGHHQDYAVETMCRALEVSVSGYYAWRSRAPSKREQQDESLLEEMRVIHKSNRQLYGSPRIHAALKEKGISCSRKRVARLMREHGIYSRRRPKRRIHTTDSRHNRPVAPNLLQRDFSASAI